MIINNSNPAKNPQPIFDTGKAFIMIPMSIDTR